MLKEIGGKNNEVRREIERKRMWTTKATSLSIFICAGNNDQQQTDSPLDPAPFREAGTCRGLSDCRDHRA